ncbi:MAG: twin-arginine translocase subunit TatC, partial [Actinobacteria bacterium]|nr:twin-arginine translocase subunit TatC [Actinomycetota bacterium]
MKLRFFKKGRVARTDDAMTLTEHLAELRSRLIRSALAVVAGMMVVLAFYEPVLDFLRQPYDNLCQRRPDLVSNCDFFTLGPLEGFNARLRISLYGGLILALPVVLWQIWRFVVPALHAKEKKYAIPFVLSSVVLFVVGGFFAYFTLDKGLEWLISWSGSDVQQAFQISKYVSFVGLMMAAFGIGFEFPVLLVFLQLVGVLRPRQLVDGWRVAVMLIVVLAAVITPSGDPITLALLSVPLAVFYFVAIL